MSYSNKKVKKKIKRISFRITDLLHNELRKSTFIEKQVIMYLVFGSDSKQRKKFKKRKFIDYRLSQLVRVEKILNVNIIYRDIYD